MNKSFLGIFLIFTMIPTVFAAVTEFTYEELKQQDKYKPFFTALNKKYLDYKELKSLVDKNPDLKELRTKNDDQTFLHHEILNLKNFKDSYDLITQLRRINYLIDLGWDVNAQDALGNCPLHYLLPFSDSLDDFRLSETLDLFKNRRARLLSPNNEGVTPLHLATQVKNPRALKWAINALPDNYKNMMGYLDRQDGFGRTPLMYALKADRKNNIDRLLRENVTVDKDLIKFVYQNKMIKNKLNDKSGQTWIHYLSHDPKNLSGLQEFLNLMNKDFQNGLLNDQNLYELLNIQDNFKYTPLHDAVFEFVQDPFTGAIIKIFGSKNEKIIKKLLAYGADPFIGNDQGISPMVNHNYESIFKYYLFLKNSFEMEQKRQTLFGQSVMNLYDRWFENEDKVSLKTMLCSDDQFPEITRMKARAFFKEKFIKEICES